MRHWIVAAVVAGLTLASVGHSARAEDKPPIKVLLVLGGCCHDYAQQKDILKKGIEERANVEVTIAYDADKTTKHLNPVYEKADWAAGYDVILHDECTADVKDLKVIDNILKPHKDGLPGVVIHCAMHCYRSEGWPTAVTPWFEFTGLQTTAHGAQKPIDVTYTDPASPITKGMDNWTTMNEELYNNIAGKLLDTARVLARGKQTAKDKKTGKETSADNVVVWTNLYNGKAKVFGTTLGHNNDTVKDAKYLDLVTRGLLWTTGHLTEDGKPAPGYEAKK